MAPELLRDPAAPPQGTPKGDVYSFAIILQECHTRRGPWSDIDLSCEGTVCWTQCFRLLAHVCYYSFRSLV